MMVLEVSIRGRPAVMASLGRLYLWRGRPGEQGSRGLSYLSQVRLTSSGVEAWIFQVRLQPLRASESLQGIGMVQADVNLEVAQLRNPR